MRWTRPAAVMASEVRHSALTYVVGNAQLQVAQMHARTQTHGNWLKRVSASGKLNFATELTEARVL